MATAAQRDSWRDALRFENETSRYNLDQEINKWKSNVGELQANMRENQMNLRRATKRYEQVAAQGGSGDYGINKYSQGIDDYKTKIENGIPDVSYTPKLSSENIKPLSALNAEMLGYNSTIDSINKGAVTTVTDRYGKTTTQPRTLTPQEEKQIKSAKESADSLSQIINEQKPFEEEETKKAADYNARLKQAEQDFVQSVLNAPPPEYTEKYVAPVPSAAQLSQKRDEIRNETMQNKTVAPTIEKPYLAQQKTSLPLSGFNMNNLKNASQRVSGQVLGGNSNKIV